MEQSKWALITGASAGFGEAIAYKLASMNYHLILVARRNERLTQISKAITDTNPQAHIHCFALDVRDKEAINSGPLSDFLQSIKIDLVVNNAGLAVGLNRLFEGDDDDWDRMIDTNIKGILYVSRLVLPKMIAQRSGHIINISSIAGKQVYPLGNVYCATKHAVDALTRSMRMETAEYGIKVGMICPGAAETEFSQVRFKGNTERAKEVYKGFDPLLAEDIAECLAFMVGRPNHVNIDDMVVTPRNQGAASQIHRDISS